jgi:hypothetical protein
MPKFAFIVVCVTAFLTVNCRAQMSAAEAQERLRERMAAATQPDALLNEIASLKAANAWLQSENDRLQKLIHDEQVPDGDTPKLGWSIDQLSQIRRISVNPTNQFYDVGSDGTLPPGQSGTRISAPSATAQEPAELQQVRAYTVIVNTGRSVSLSDLDSGIRAAFDVYNVLIDVDTQKIANVTKLSLDKSTSGDLEVSSTDTSNDAGGDYNDGKTVHVNGYMRSNGTYVNSYDRSPPSRR